MRLHRFLLTALLAATLVHPDAAAAQGTESALEFHAALNTAVGRAKDLPVLGIPTYATFDYRTAMLQFRYKVNEHDQFVVQLLNRRLGNSPLAAAIPDVSMQWAFWQRRSTWGALKIGRAPMPRGIFNEIRFVGTVLPFFRPSFEIYGEGRETVDGAVFTRRQPLGRGFSFDVSAFGGSNEVRTQVVTATGNSIRAFRGNNLKGVQGWLNIPFGETRVGGFYADYHIDSDTARGTRGEILYSAETRIVPRTTLRGEALRIYGIGPAQDRKSYSTEAVVNIVERFDLSGQYSFTDNRIFQRAPLLNVNVDATKDIAVGATYRIGGGALVRLEHHTVEGYAFDRFVPLLTNVNGQPVVAPPSKGSYWLGSFAVSF
ncbi:MAG TPA: hypothetical protein VE861_03100 [Gemmatimonadaceae bacterium]|nr:hypothetical protein [Gemmatimonadaceae bacterium]